MKKIIILILALASLSSFAQRREGSMTLRDGRSIIRIDVGDDRDDRDMLRRVRRLEQAVRDLQDKVYELQSAPAPRNTYVVCSGEFFTVGSLSARGNTETEARSALAQSCQRRVNSMFCKTTRGENSVRCEQGVE